MRKHPFLDVSLKRLYHFPEKAVDRRDSTLRVGFHIRHDFLRCEIGVCNARDLLLPRCECCPSCDYKMMDCFYKRSCLARTRPGNDNEADRRCARQAVSQVNVCRSIRIMQPAGHCATLDARIGTTVLAVELSTLSSTKRTLASQRRPSEMYLGTLQPSTSSANNARAKSVFFRFLTWL